LQRLTRNIDKVNKYANSEDRDSGAITPKTGTPELSSFLTPKTGTPELFNSEDRDSGAGGTPELVMFYSFALFNSGDRDSGAGIPK